MAPATRFSFRPHPPKRRCDMGDKKGKKEKNKSDKQKANKQEKIKEEQKSKTPKKSS
jgi:hypothetical protein